jgi:protein PhnA
MTKGYDKHQHRHDALSQFGKALARRSGSHCELCDAGNTPLRVFEVPPVPADADFERCIFICDRCKEQINSPKKRDPKYLRCLNRSVWSEIIPVQVMALYLLTQLADEEWAQDLLDQVYLQPEIEQWLNTINT